MPIGVVGYGTGGQPFHTPIIEAADGVELVGASRPVGKTQSRGRPGLARRADLPEPYLG